jgi:hypothetical protein
MSQKPINFYFSQISADFIADLRRSNKLKIALCVYLLEAFNDFLNSLLFLHINYIHSIYLSPAYLNPEYDYSDHKTYKQ